MLGRKESGQSNSMLTNHGRAAVGMGRLSFAVTQSVQELSDEHSSPQRVSVQVHSAVAGEQGNYTTQAPGEKQGLPSFDQHLGGRDTNGRSSYSFQQKKLKPYAVAAIHAITERDSQS